MAYVVEPQVQYRQHKNNSIGSRKKSDTINSFDEMRDLFIDVKIDHFKILMENSGVFESENIEKLNKVSYEYFKKLKNKKEIGFKDYKLFCRLYRYENFVYRLENFLILNMPRMARLLFSFVKGVKKQ